MGWWKVDGTDDVVGDDAFGALRNAAIAVAEMYDAELRRRPTQTEWQSLVRDALEPIEEHGVESPSPMFHEGGRA